MTAVTHSYVKNIDKVSKNAGTMHASAIPRRKRTTKRPAKFVHGICSNVMPPLDTSKCTKSMIATQHRSYQTIKFVASHLPTGKHCKAQFCGYSAIKYLWFTSQYDSDID